MCAGHAALDSTYDSRPECMMACLGYSTEVLQGTSQTDQIFGYGDTVQCRLHHRWASVYDNNTDLHFGHASEDSTEDTCSVDSVPNETNYCAFAATFCPDMFANNDVCTLAVSGLEEGTFIDTSGHTLGCLNYWLMTAPTRGQDGCGDADPVDGLCAP
jgi:hypothetical protein